VHSVDPHPERDPGSAAIAQRLRELPSELPPPFDWNELQRRTGPQVASRSARQAVLLAAGLASIVAVAALVSRFVGMRGEPAHHGLPAVTQNTFAPATPADLRGRDDGHDSERLLQRAKAAERWLASEPDDEPIVQVSTYLAVSALEDRIASMDDQLSTERVGNVQAGRVRALQLQRARLVDSLAQVRYAELLAAELP
jgi:hypothetical protein